MYYFDEYIFLAVNHLSVVPLLGGQVEISFFKAKVGTTTFFVESIHHRFTDDLQIVDIDLKVGKYNHYWPIRKDEAYLKGEITWHEYFRSNDSAIKKRLKLHGW